MSTLSPAGASAERTLWTNVWNTCPAWCNTQLHVEGSHAHYREIGESAGIHLSLVLEVDAEGLPQYPAAIIVDYDNIAGRDNLTADDATAVAELFIEARRRLEAITD